MFTRPARITGLVRPLLPGRHRGLASLFAPLLMPASLLVLPAGQALETTAVILAGEQFQVELAVSRAAKQRGLMHRERLAQGTGMLFIYATARPTRFWNRDVRFPIDILYFDANQAFLRADSHVPPCPELPCPVYHSGQPVKYVLELPAGSRERLGLQPGQTFRFRSPARPAGGTPQR